MKRSIALLYLGLLFSVYSQVSYEYRFDKADSSATYLEEHSSASNPKIHINGSNSPPMIVPMGLLYGDNSASLINTSPYLPMTKPFTVTFWVYLFRTDQEAYLISRYQSSGSYIGLKIKNGKLVTVSKGGASATTETTSSSMYKVGWNTISLSFHTTSFVMRGMSRFGTLNVETFAEQAVGSSNEVSIGGSIQGSSVVQSLSGIINRMWYYGGQISDVTFQTLYSFTSSCSMKCDHYIAMLYDMTEFRPGTTDQFKDPLYDLGTYSYYQCEMSYYGAGTPAASLGISLNSSNDEKIKSADTRFDSSYSLGVEFWIKGTPFATDSFVYFKNRSNNKVLLMLTKNNAGGLNINNGYQAVVTVANVFATWVNTEWTYISASLGPTKNANEFGACVVIKQSSYIDFTTCLYNTGIQNGVNTVDNINLRIGGGFDGYMKELYVYTGMLRVDSLIEQQGLVNWYPNRKLYPCHITDYLEEPHCISEGCGNGIINSTIDTAITEYCDDGNNDDDDGCSSTCEVEDLYECPISEAIDISMCTFVCGDGELDTSVGEECDDGDTGSLDGCSSICEVEDGWSCTTTNGALSVCTANCGDGLKVAGEACEDGGTDDTSGCLDDCSGPVNGYTCSGGDLSNPDTCVETCGDGYRTENEDCDDNDTDTGDGCDDNCEVEDGWTCTSTLGALSTCSAASCGDGYRVGAESCDDNNNDNTEGCLADCSGSVNGYTCSGGDGSGPDTCTETCGDGYLTVSEECDDNDTDTGDGCDDNCEVEDGWSCTNTIGALSTCSAASCGDGYRVGAEVCDDNNNDNTEGCLADCTGSVDGYTCSGGDGSGPDTCTEVCGDGYLTVSEECDDNDTDTHDGCDDNCEVEDGWTCTSTLGATSTCSAASCGDGYRVGSEVCDDNNNDDTEGCLADCTGAVDGYTCTGGDGSGPDTCIETCGDGYLTASEECDDNDTDTGDGCDDNCEIEDGWSCTNTLGSTSTCSAGSCGDGYRVGAEVCDDGNTDNSEGCLADCTGSVNGYTCSGGDGTGPDTCTENCGDGYRTTGEECDDNDIDDLDGCDSNCQIEDGWTCSTVLGATSSCTPDCGDSRKVAGETCDDGNTDGDSGCNADCSAFVSGWSCANGDINTADDCTSTCGDGIKTTDEECDDNDLDNLDGCDNSCYVEAGWDCTQVLHAQSSCTQSCGNSVRDGMDECDDGNTINDGDGCTNDCTIESGWKCAEDVAGKSICTEKCGDGVVDDDEECDDKNTQDSGDGCTNQCKIEDGWKCGEDILGTSVCFLKCGDGEISEDEECDDSNTDDGDGCSSSCKLESGYSVSNDGKVLISPTVSLVSISKQNLMKIEFSQEMTQFDINTFEDALTVSIEGPMDSYSFSYTAEFTSSTQMELQLTLNNQIVGRKEETCTVKYNTTLFKSTEGVNLRNGSISGEIFQKQVAAKAIEQGGAATSSVLGFTMGTIILSNVLLGDEIELLWGFMNTLQIITYFPFLQLYLPQFLSDFIESLSISNLKISIGFIDDAIEDFQNYWIGNEDYDLATEDETYEENDINSMSVIRNAAGMLTILSQGLIVCMIAYAIKAKFITTQDEINKRTFKSRDTISFAWNTFDHHRKQPIIKTWIRSKIIDICDGYKYHFFIRLGFQLYLEAILLTMLNLSVFKFKNWAHYASYFVSIILLVVLVLVSVLVYKFNFNHYKQMTQGQMSEDNPFSILFYEYKTDHIMYLQYHTFFMLRRVGYAFCIVFLESWPFYQNCGVVLLFVTKLSYQAVFRPFKNTIFNVMMTLNEMALVGISCSFYWYVAPSTNTDFTDMVGWCILFTIACMVIINLLILWLIKISKWSKGIASLMRSLRKNKEAKTSPNRDEKDHSISFARQATPRNRQ